MSKGESPGRGTDRSLPSAGTGDRHQKQLVRLLRERSDPLTVRDLAVELAAMVEEKPPSEVTTEERRRMRAVLYHRYLPALRDAGLMPEWMGNRPRRR